ncbi:tetratricopeptide repeat protein [Xanthocytophaga agilis]|uniref:Tetratricopeptide repeat protein n=1 Tax=Xanthocytophaga agilis TaxID=3048010 RepID=A0AAE3R302_9BACT|nr:tetratricopeptide repeat protein [Xanthocytophaga agilis]MDJ1500704.1 tetratricopeptide repeat protein [Xanthocytophaga agilis]
MKKYFLILYIGVFSLAPSGCQLLDPTQDIVNPNITKEAVLASQNPMTPWVDGLERQLAIVYNNVIVNLEIASDNYQNTRTFYNQQLDAGTMLFTDTDINNIQFSIADLRESAVFGLTELKAADPETTPDQEAELYFYKGWAELLAGEIFVALPAEPIGVALTPQQNFELAVADFQKALELTTDATRKPGYHLALARVYYNLGDKTNAKSNAEAAITLSPAYLRSVRYEGVSSTGPVSTMQDALFDRGTFDDLQPLPRLDFLDPKYYGRGNGVESPIYYQKIEEAHLILAEIAIADKDLSAAKSAMNNTILIANSRAKATFSDASEDRPQPVNPNVAAGDRPDNSNIKVAASPEESLRSGLVLSRKSGPITMSIISGTSLTEAAVNALSSEDDILENLYLLRQEIFLAEGRRAVDLGIKLPVSETEKLTNPNITNEQTVGFIPTFVPKNKEMDAFEYNKAAGTCVIKVNMNKVLVANKTSTSVVPFE